VCLGQREEAAVLLLDVPGQQADVIADSLDDLLRGALLPRFQAGVFSLCRISRSIIKAAFTMALNLFYMEGNVSFMIYNRALMRRFHRLIILPLGGKPGSRLE